MNHGRLLPRSAPSAEQVDAKGVMALLDRLDERSVECHSLMVVRHGRVVAEGWWAPYSRDRPQLLYSVTKSFISIAVGFAVADGLLGLHDRVADVLDDHVPAHVSPRARQFSVHHLLTMTTGHRADALADAWALEPADLVKGFLRVSALPHGTLVMIDPVGGGWRVRFDTGETVLDVEVGDGTWRESAPLGRPVVAAGAWQGAAFVADIYVITSPSRVRLVAAARRAVATWNIVPATGPDLLRQLRSPLMTRPDVA